jgi:UDP-N-acetylmuramyl pentapeptide phosphotransferase/UDP-N-acetylglucosamine-1-phosphate transferase
MMLGCVVWVLSAAFGAGGYCWLVNKYPSAFRTLNFQGLMIPASAGAAVVLACYVSYNALQLGQPDGKSHLYVFALAVVVSFGLLGLADDLRGDRSVGGLKGHLGLLLHRRRLSTGAAKAIGGTLISLVVGYFLHRTNPLEALLAALIIALSANAVNLTDTRPGRCLAVYFCLSAGGFAFGIHHVTSGVCLTFLPPLLMAIVIFIFDRKARLMIGDAGSNTYGALAGLLWACIAPATAQAGLLVALIWFHWWTEHHSLSKTIERIPWMKKLDNTIGVRR